MLDDDYDNEDHRAKIWQNPKMDRPNLPDRKSTKTVLPACAHDERLSCIAQYLKEMRGYVATHTTEIICI
jgi:hypothetical protein